VDRTEAGRERDQAEIDRAVAASERAKVAELPDPSEAIEQAKVLGEQARTVMGALAAAEENIARTFDQLAASRQDQRSEHRHTAEQARSRARKIREDLRASSD
jgi:hypothetical protein